MIDAIDLAIDGLLEDFRADVKARNPILATMGFFQISVKKHYSIYYTVNEAEKMVNFVYVCFSSEDPGRTQDNILGRFSRFDTNNAS